MFVAMASEEGVGFLGRTREKFNLHIGLLAVAVAGGGLLLDRGENVLAEVLVGAARDHWPIAAVAFIALGSGFGKLEDLVVVVFLLEVFAVCEEDATRE